MQPIKIINIYTKNLKGLYVYEVSTATYKTCKEAKKSFLSKHTYLHASQVKASYK